MVKLIVLAVVVGAFCYQYLGWPGAIRAAAAFVGLTLVPCIVYFSMLNRTKEDVPRMIWFYRRALVSAFIVAMISVYLVGAGYVAL